jgi:predicted secreted protein
MRSTTAVTLLAGLLCLCLLAAGPLGAAKLQRTKPQPIQTLVVEKGRIFNITLASNQSTGYRWMLAGKPNPKVLKILGQGYKPSDPKRLGSGGREVWSFKAVGSGRAVISLHYLRSWEKDKTPVHSRLIEVDVP